MDKNFNFKLVHGTFTAPEAAKILFALISSKIQFHTIENFSSQERFGKEAPNSQKRIQALKDAQDSLKKVFAEAEKNEMHLNIEGSVTVTIVE